MEEKNCMTCKNLKTGRYMLCKRKRKDNEIVDVFNTCCKKYEWNKIETKRDVKY